MTVPSDRREAKSACGCYVEWNGSEWRVSASSFLCDHKQGDRIDGAPPADRRDDTQQECGAFGCKLPAGHNRGRADIPENHGRDDTQQAREAVRDPTFEQLSETIARYPDPDDKLTIALGNFHRVRIERDSYAAQYDEAVKELAALVAERDRYENALREARKFVRLGGPLSADDRVELVAMLSKALWSSRRSEA